MDDKPATARLYDNIEKNIVNAWRLANKNRIEKELADATIVEAPRGTHTSFLFLSNDFLAKTIKTFLDTEK